MNCAVRVCPDRDIECGSNSNSWCASCPKRGTQNKGLVPAGALDCQRLGVALARHSPIPRLEGFNFVVDSEAPDPSTVAGSPAMYSEGMLTRPHIDHIIERMRASETLFPVIIDPMPLRAAAFEIVRTLVNSEDQDGVLAKIRLIVNACP